MMNATLRTLILATAAVALVQLGRPLPAGAGPGDGSAHEAVTDSGAAAGPVEYATGSRIEPFTIRDQHDVEHQIDESLQLIVFARDMDAGDIAKEALADADAAALASRHAVYIADISAMPALVARLFALPKMRKRPYPVLLDRDGELTAAFPEREGELTVMRLRELEVVDVEHLDNASAVREALSLDALADPAAAGR